MCVKNRRKHRFCGTKEVPTRFLTLKPSKTSILRSERGTIYPGPPLFSRTGPELSRI